MENQGNEVLLLIPILGGLVLILIVSIIAHKGLAGIVARRYLSHFKLKIVSTITIFAVVGTTLAVAALTTVTGISTGFQAEFQRKVLGVNAHVLILKYLDFTEYREVMDTLRQIPGVVGVNPFVINEMMIVNGPRIAGILLKGVDPELMPTVLDLPEHIVNTEEFQSETPLIRGDFSLLRVPGREPPEARMPTWNRSWPEPDPLMNGSANDDELIGVPGTVRRNSGDNQRNTPSDETTGERNEEDLEGIAPSQNNTSEASDQVLDEAVAEALDIEFDSQIEPTRPESLPGIILGRTLARELDVHVGDTVRIVTPLSGLDVSLWAPEAQVPRSREFLVIGIFYSGFDEYDTRLVYIDLFEAQAFYDHGDVVTGVELRLEDPDMAPRVAAEVENQLGGSPYRILDWEELNHNLFTALRIQKIALTVVVSALVLVSALLIIATLVLMIFEKKREIAILKAMGATNGAIMNIFVLVGLTIGSIGTFLGVALGFGICKFLIAFGWDLDPGVYLIDKLPIEIDTVDYIVVSTVSLGISFLATILPSWFTAATMRPVEGLRDE